MSTNADRIPPETRIGEVHLRVSDLDRALDFYAGLLGFHQLRRENGTAALSASGQAPAQIHLTEDASARPRPPRTTGLFHTAIRLPGRRELARLLVRLRERRWPLQGASDHRVSEALYLADPDQNGVELYVDRPRETWPWKNGQVAMTTDRLDLDSLAAEADDNEPWTGIASGADIGHIHLQVADLDRAEAFYVGLLGLDVTQRDYPGARFLSAGGYHHHLGLNVWAGPGAPPPPPGAAGLASYTLDVPAPQTVHVLAERLRQAGLPVEPGENTFRTRDPDHNNLDIRSVSP